ncbi:C25 family cysteine peptidase [Desulfofundulus thermosubterraneus]|uniref:Cohesin domain-containing protein n=1 Tax=Desulfofundulus thermosubterraneus DSM 16057 TaxID=1121432 RepID=A0A1M6GU12_9FIRM|nr:C25 family cysteine peptidase [Desulfofundulus thermosubterraneus]SHJ13454.1 Cohesin domain-containing protein [Desulfofundulus thermosubterraneus DSM 16057]
MRRKAFIGFGGLGLFSLFLILLFVYMTNMTSAAWAKTEVNRIGDELHLTYYFPSPKVERRTATGYDVVYIPGLKMESLPGKPLIPVRQAFVLVPAGKEVAEVRIVGGAKRVLGHFKLEPGAKPKPLASTAKPSEPVPDPEIYSSAAPYHAKPLGNVAVQYKSGCPIVIANLYPVEYVPKTGQVSYYEQLTLVVRFRPSNARPRFLPSKIDSFMIRRMVDNPSELNSYLSTPLPTGRSWLLRGFYDYLIITSRALAPAFTPLAEWRSSQGLQSAVVCVEDIYATYPGRDPQEQIRNFLREAKEKNGISFVLLGGDGDRKDVGGESEDPIVPTRALYCPPVEGDCLVEAIAKTQEPGAAKEIIGTLREFRDACLHPDYIRMYYRYSPMVYRVLFTNPFLLRQATTILTKYTPWFGDLTAGKEGPVLSEADTRELCSFVASLREEIRRCHGDRYTELVRELEQIESYLSGVAGKSFSEAFWASPYAARQSSQFSSGDGFPLGPEDIAGDLYYACLDGSYDGNGNRIYGEPCDGEDGGDVDLLAELYVGRAPVDSPEEASTFVAKTIAYEKGAASKEAWMVGEDLGWKVWGSDYKNEIKDGSSNHGYTTAGFPPVFEVQTLYDTPERKFMPEEALQVLNSGPHLLNHLGHAYNTYVMKLENEDVDKLENSRTFFLYTQGCYAGSFDNRDDSNWAIDEDCIAEHLVAQQAGAFAVIANSRYGWGDDTSTNGTSQRYDREFWDAVFGEGIPWLGVANQDSKEDSVGLAQTDDYMRFCYYELNLLGDPAVRIAIPGQEAVVLCLPETASGGPGGVVTVPLTVQKAAGVAGFQFTLVWDASWLTEPHVEKGGLISGDSGWNLDAQPVEGGLKVIGYNLAGQTLGSSEGELVKLSFRVAKDAPPGATAHLRFEDAIVNDAAGCSLPVSTVEGNIIVVTRAKGDVNGDGVVDVQDVVRTVNIALGRVQPNDEERNAADANGDGVINVLDVVLIANIALGRV